MGVRNSYPLANKLAPARRNNATMQMTSLGLTNAEIRWRLEPPMHEKSAARIGVKMRRR